MVGRYYFAIVGHKDEALFELEHQVQSKASTASPEENRHLNQFIAHAALDVIDDQMWNTKDTFLRSVDRFNDWFVSAFVTPGKMRFVLLHDEPNEHRIRNFFMDVYEIYIKLTLNPFFDRHKTINSQPFTQKVQRLASKQFG